MHCSLTTFPKITTALLSIDKFVIIALAISAILYVFDAAAIDAEIDVRIYMQCFSHGARLRG